MVPKSTFQEEILKKMKAFGKTKFAILETIAALQRKHGKSYCYPTQYTLLKLLKTHHKISISRRALNYALADLQGADLIDRKQRIRKGSAGQMIFNSTLYFFKKAGYVFLNKFKRFGSLIEAVFKENKLRRILAAAPATRENCLSPVGDVLKLLIPV